MVLGGGQGLIGETRLLATALFEFGVGASVVLLSSVSRLLLRTRMTGHTTRVFHHFSRL